MLLALPMVVWLAICTILFTIQDKMVFVPFSAVEHTPAELDLEFEELELQTRDGERIHGWFVDTENSRGTVVYCHGNGGNIGGRMAIISAMAERGFDLLIFDYRGYGKSTGTPSEEGIYLDLATVWEHLTVERGIDPSSIVIWGRSLGGAMAIYMATELADLDGERAPAAVVLEATFTSLPDTAAEEYWMFPVQLLVRTKLPSLERIPKLRAPLLHAHSPTDTLIPYAHGQKLHEAASSEHKRFVDLSGNHNDNHLSKPRYGPQVAEFFDEVLPRPASVR
jgi:fermentation-respiration switch protein FrsA (DUF1100 family)